jgi:hypothetical protein
MLFVIFLSPLRQIPGYSASIKPRALPSIALLIHSSVLLSRFMCVIIDVVWIGEWIY